MRKKRFIICLITCVILITVIISIGMARLKRESDASFDYLQEESIDTIYQINVDNIKIDEKSGISYINNIVLIYFDDNVSKETKESIVNAMGGTIVGELQTVNQCQVQIKSKSLPEILEICSKLESNPNVVLATYDEVYLNLTASSCIPDDPWTENAINNWLADEIYEKVKWDENAPGESNWWAEAIQLPSAWANDDCFSRIKIGIIDTGFDIEHEDLIGKITFPSYAYAATNFPSNHGTRVAGIIGAHANNKKGITGIVWDSELICVDYVPNKLQNIIVNNDKKLNAWSTSNVIAAGIIETVKADAKVINLSLGANKGYLNSHEDRLSDEQIQKLSRDSSLIMGALLSQGKDFVIVQAAGNGVVDNGFLGIEIGVDATYNGWFCSITPDNCVDKYKSIVQDMLDRIIVVGAYMQTEAGYIQTKFSNGGDRVDIVAPGYDIYSTVAYSLNDLYRYQRDRGTSFAAPIVTGVAALVWSVDPSFTGAEVKSIVCDERSTSEPIPDNPDSPNATGDFRGVNAYKAVKLAIEKSQEKKEKEIIQAQKIDEIIGTYKGSYMAEQGETALTLTIYKDGTDYKARFDFDNLLGRNNAEKGSYCMDISYNFDTDSYYFKATEWIEKPTWYTLLDLEGIYQNGVLRGDSPAQFKVTRVEKYTEPTVYLDNLIGTYQGTYNLSLWVEAGMSLDVYKEGLVYKAKCDFYALSNQSNVSSGSFIYSVSYSELNGYYLFEGEEWIEHPVLYTMPTLQGKLKDDILSGRETTRFELKRTKKADNSQFIKEAMDAYFQVAILGYDSLLDAVDAGQIEHKDMISDEVRQTMLKAAPEHAWRNLPFAQNLTIDDILIQYIGLYRNYIWENYIYNVGEDYEITYEITSITQMSQQEIAAFDAKISNLSAISGQAMDSNNVKEQSKYTLYTPVIEAGTLEDACNIIVKYSASGSKKTWIRSGQYTAIKTKGQWYILKDGYHQIFWDHTITEGMSGTGTRKLIEQRFTIIRAAGLYYYCVCQSIWL